MANPISVANRPRERFIPNPKARLREQFREVARFKHLSLRTEEAYWDWVVRFLRFHRTKHLIRPTATFSPSDAEKDENGSVLTFDSFKNGSAINRSRLKAELQTVAPLIEAGIDEKGSTYNNVHILVGGAGREIYQGVMPRRRRVEYAGAMFHPPSPRLRRTGVMNRGDRREDVQTLAESSQKAVWLGHSAGAIHSRYTVSIKTVAEEEMRASSSAWPAEDRSAYAWPAEDRSASAWPTEDRSASAWPTEDRSQRTQGGKERMKNEE